MAAERTAAERLLRPRSVAFVGGSIAAAALELCRDVGFGGPVRAVHPTRELVTGLNDSIGTTMGSRYVRPAGAGLAS